MYMPPSIAHLLPNSLCTLWLFNTVESGPFIDDSYIYIYNIFIMIYLSKMVVFRATLNNQRVFRQKEPQACLGKHHSPTMRTDPWL